MNGVPETPFDGVLGHDTNGAMLARYVAMVYLATGMRPRFNGESEAVPVEQVLAYDIPPAGW